MSFVTNNFLIKKIFILHALKNYRLHLEFIIIYYILFNTSISIHFLKFTHYIIYFLYFSTIVSFLFLHIFHSIVMYRLAKLFYSLFYQINYQQTFQNSPLPVPNIFQNVAQLHQMYLLGLMEIYLLCLFFLYTLGQSD